MAVDVVFSDAKKGYNKDEVQRFIMQLTSDHTYAINEKNDAIKTLMNEKDAMERSYAAKIAELEAALEAAQADNKEKTAKYDELCARMGEKLLFAESRSAQIVAEAEESKQRIEAEAQKKAEETVAAVAAKAREDAAAALRAADVLRQKSQNINAGLDHTKRVLEEAIAAIERLVKND